MKQSVVIDIQLYILESVRTIKPTQTTSQAPSIISLLRCAMMYLREFSTKYRLSC